MLFEVMACPVGYPDAFDPAMFPLQFQVPAIGRVVGHLIRPMLSKSEPLRANSELYHQFWVPARNQHCRMEDDASSMASEMLISFARF